MSAPSKYDILTDIDVSDRHRERWQGTLNILADLLEAPVALVMRVHGREIEVFARSDSDGNVYEESETAPLDSGLYCETVMTNRAELMVPDALADPQWDHNPDIKLGMISYLGLPLEWPTGHIFGTICVLDIQPHEYSMLHRATMQQFRDLVQDELALLFENHLLKQEVAEREQAERELLEMQRRLESLARRLQVGREHERALLARGLHDEIIHNLTAAKMDLDTCLRRLPEALQHEMRSHVEVVDERLMATVRRVREMCDGLVPAVLEDLGLAAAVDWVVADFGQRTGTACTVRTQGDELRLSSGMQYVVFRTLEQTLRHIAAAGPATLVAVTLQQGTCDLKLLIAAEGHRSGEASGRAAEEMGLKEVETQAATWGGRVRTWRTPEDVAYVELSMPSDAA
jgi:signal transduction histidine kinase